MIVLQDSRNDQTFKFIPREDYTGEACFFFYDKLDGVQSAFELTVSKSGYYHTVTGNFDGLEEEHEYILIVKNAPCASNGDEIFRSKVFITNQADYSITNGIYTEREQSQQYAEYEG